MRPLSPAVCRRSLLAALLAALAIAGCGGGKPNPPGEEGSAAYTGEIKTTTTVGREGGKIPTGPDTGGDTSGDAGAKGKRPSPSCEAQLGPLLHSLDRLRVRLATGLSYEQYSGAVGEARRAYADLDAEGLSATCLLVAGTAAERSLNRYIEATNSWGACLADAGCDARVVEPALQRDWQVASHWLSEAHAGLEGLA